MVLRIFISHSGNNDICEMIVKALRSNSDVDVYYDNDDLSPGNLIESIERELTQRSIFILVLSPTALNSTWVRDEAQWFYRLMRRDPRRIFIPIVAQPIEEQDMWLFLLDFKRIQIPEGETDPYPQMINKLLRMLGFLSFYPEKPKLAEQNGLVDDRFSDVNMVLSEIKKLISEGNIYRARELFEFFISLSYPENSLDTHSNEVTKKKTRKGGNK